MSIDIDGENPPHDLSAWPDERLEVIRVVAQGHAYDAELPEEVRRQWAWLSVLANRRMSGDGSGGREAHQEFMLRMWVIDTLGPDPEWSPITLAADTLSALSLTPSEARSLARNWRDLPIDEIRKLRRHKNLTAHLERLISHLQPGPTRDRLLLWTEVRRLLP
ncbi:hypothetical protein OHT76_40940 [Streptomyces sp. NBC_00287]|uniref:hypothetical protein n=1 Tax=Streptomyces sp. NBC_00287 TaxID=2975702 RepID=UPI002E2858EE|nr:hypothetical protein [Streptomyces sp. NBC_00287]